VRETSAETGLVNDLRAFVRKEGYGAGDRLPPIRKLSRVLGAGRNVVRDGLLEAQTLGLVKIEPRQGVFVQGVFVQGGHTGRRTDGFCRMLENVLGGEKQNLIHLVDARLLVETELAGAAARTRRPEDLLPLRQALENVLAAGEDRSAYIEADEAFHLAIARISGNRVLLAFLETLCRLIRPAKAPLLLSPQNRRVTDREHQELFQSIVVGDPARARKTMDEHIRQGRALLLDYARTIPTTFAAPPTEGRSKRRASSPQLKRKKIGGKRP
jgi:DNA-binding FadR family transcriptional regulator